MKPNPSKTCVSQPWLATRRRAFLGRFALPVLAMLTAASSFAALGIARNRRSTRWWPLRRVLAMSTSRRCASPRRPRRSDRIYPLPASSLPSRLRPASAPNAITRVLLCQALGPAAALQHLRRGLRRRPLLASRLGGDAGHQLAGLRPGRIRRPRPTRTRAPNTGSASTTAST